MMGRLFRLLVLVLLVSCAPSLERGDWEEEPYRALSALLKDKSLSGGYAVFDCDNTTILHDVTHTLMVWQIENLEFADAVAEMFLHGLAKTDFPLEGLDMTAAEMGSYLHEEYVLLRSLLDSGQSLGQVHETDNYLDFRAAFLSFYKAIGNNYSYGELCLWEPMLFSGLSRDRAEESLAHSLSQGRVWNEEWVSPDCRFRGVAEKGIVIPEDIKNLYSALRRNGVTPYICSASPEWLVETLVCNPDNGLGMDPEEVYGVRFIDGDYDRSYPQPFKEGKVDCIDSMIAPLHSGMEPVLVAGDSSGDVAMLTAYSGMKVGLIMNQHRGGEIERLAGSRNGRYVSQTITIEYE